MLPQGISLKLDKSCIYSAYSTSWESMIKLLAMFLFIGFASGESEVDNEEGKDFSTLDLRIDSTYQKGPYLIYDCIEKRWICTGKPEYDMCEERRESALAMKEELLGCAAFTFYKTRKKCYKKQLEMIHRGSTQRFCLHPEYRDRNKDFWKTK